MSQTLVDAGRRHAARAAGGVALAVAAVSVAAQISVPVLGTPVPQSLQTLAVLVAGVWLGPVRGAIALVVYVALGAAGLPVFADGARGATHLTGPTVGYLVGFVAAASLLGWWKVRGWAGGLLPLFAGMVLGHVLILGLGWARLAVMMGAGEAFGAGVGPFIVGGLVKSAVGAAFVIAVHSLRVRATSP